MTGTPGSRAGPSGWYKDPYGQPVLRWWDGRRWTAQTQAAPGYGRQSSVEGGRATLPKTKKPRKKRNIVASFVVAAVLVAAVSVGIESRGSHPQSWYVSGKDYATANYKAGDIGTLVGVSPGFWCADALNSFGSRGIDSIGVPLNAPPSGAGIKDHHQWVAGCIAGYYATRPGSEQSSPPSPQAAIPGSSPPIQQLSLTCTLEYHVPEQHPIGNADGSEYGWVPAVDNDGAGGGQRIWSGTFTDKVPRYYTQGVAIGITDSGTLPEEPAEGYPITVVFSDAAGTTVYIAHKSVRIDVGNFNPAPSGGVLVNMPVGSRATGADQCTASQSAS